MKRAFIRGLWGDMGGIDRGITPRRLKVLRDIERVVGSSFPMEFVTYIFGTDNMEIFEKKGLPYVLVDKDNVRWDMITELYRHKLEILKRAMEDYDQIVYLDWDCVLTKDLPPNVWEILAQGETCQANLFQYRTKKCLWRNEDVRKTCNGGFIYIGDKLIPTRFIENWEELKKWAEDLQEKRKVRGLDLRFREKSLMFDDEPSISKYIDDYCGGWPGVDVYWDKFEPKICDLRKKSAFTKEQNASKNACFRHFL